MGWLTDDKEGENMERILNDITSGLFKAICLFMFVYSSVLLYLIFQDDIRAALRCVQNILI